MYRREGTQFCTLERAYQNDDFHGAVERWSNRHSCHSVDILISVVVRLSHCIFMVIHDNYFVTFDWFGDT